jgi:O-antigen/teichoic acid export membrane protein
MAFAASLYPALSLYWKHNRGQLSVTFERAINYLIIISLPLSVGIFVLADKIVLIFKSGYADAVLPLRIIIIQLVFSFLNFPVGSLLNACDRQKRNTINMGLVAALSVAMNLVLIPRWGVAGASITSTLTAIFQVAIGLYVVPKIIHYRAGKNIVILLKSLLAAGIMAAMIYYLKNRLNVFVVSGLGGAAYFAVLYGLKGFRKEDIFSILKSFRKKGSPEDDPVNPPIVSQ